MQAEGPRRKEWHLPKHRKKGKGAGKGGDGKGKRGGKGTYSLGDGTQEPEEEGKEEEKDQCWDNPFPWMLASLMKKKVAKELGTPAPEPPQTAAVRRAAPATPKLNLCKSYGAGGYFAPLRGSQEEEEEGEEEEAEAPDASDFPPLAAALGPRQRCCNDADCKDAGKAAPQGKKKKLKRVTFPLWKGEEPTVKQPEARAVYALKKKYEGYKPIQVVVDSAAVDCVLAKGDSDKLRGDTQEPLKKGPAAKEGICYIAADGVEIPNEGELDVAVNTQEGHECQMTWQVADIQKTLLAVPALTKSGHEVVFRKKDGYIRNLKSGRTIKFDKKGELYITTMWMSTRRPSEKSRSSSFRRPE